MLGHYFQSSLGVWVNSLSSIILFKLQTGVRIIKMSTYANSFKLHLLTYLRIPFVLGLYSTAIARQIRIH